MMDVRSNFHRWPTPCLMWQSDEWTQAAST